MGYMGYKKINQGQVTFVATKKTAFLLSEYQTLPFSITQFPLVMGEICTAVTQPNCGFNKGDKKDE